MNVLVTGGSGFIASQIVADLILAGHNVTCCARNTKNLAYQFPTANMLQCDVTQTDRRFWEQALTSIDAIINCAGMLTSFSKKKMWSVHFDAPKLMFDVANEMNINHLVQISALGIEQSQTQYAKSKKALDDYLIEQKIPCHIVRPSLVYATGSYGGTSLFRGFCALPGILALPGGGQQKMQPIFLKDVALSVLELLSKPNDKAEIIYAVGPEKLSLRIVLEKVRNWLGYKPAKVIDIPMRIIAIITAFFDVFRSPVLNKTTFELISVDNVVSTQEMNDFFEKLSFKPKKMTAALLENPSYVQDRWHAKLYFLRPFLRLSIAFVWLATAFMSWKFPIDKSFELLTLANVPKLWQPIFLYGSISIVFLLGFFTLINYKIKVVGFVQCILIVFYSVIIFAFLPQWWTHPFGPMIKNVPIIAAIFVMMSLEDSR